MTGDFGRQYGVVAATEIGSRRLRRGDFCRDYSAAALTGATNCETHLFRRLRPSRYMPSNSAGAKECVEGRLISALPHASKRGNFSIWPSFLTRSRKK